MGTVYSQLSLEERCEIARLQANGCSIRQIAASLDRAPSSISREVKRNSPGQAGYRPAWAEEKTWARRWRGARLARQPDLRNTVINRLAMGWSPEQVAGRLARDEPSIRISHESIYRFIYAQIRRTNDFSWRGYLPRGKFKRGLRKSKGGSPVENIKERVSIRQRPAQVERRRQPGHWETDYLLFSRYGQSLLVAQERVSRFILLAKLPSRQADPTATQLHNWFSSLPKPLRRSLTHDNGTEFAHHYRLRDKLHLKTYFCDPHSPWQKGGIENANGRLRRFLPRKSDLNQWSHNHIQALAHQHNHTPRKCLGYQTPAEIFSSLLLHFKCESTSRLSPG